ncbi:uncharacterized protein LY89DRAFT_685719 [Mollisia scopiformis]|uniref:N-acetyltransferase domain-containing protein n=1 Tax=Mollisia scopiformis TaxID=149040 RepID=A0A194X6I4_MOLSC|nr:uncharacterized protein LY89DRAFT_685719 [Mollisia scopiformis]KUJ15778.1 hypothetical protein LY89DRAFT_685719 [Mollisia scopiformis]
MSTISILPTALQDYHPIAALETHVFHDDPFSIVGFGPLRASPSNIARRAANLAAPSSRPGEWSLVTKAVDERGVVVGAAVWGLVTGRKGEVNGGKEEGKEKGEWKQEDWGESANQRFCEEVFVRGDEHMVRSCGVGDYASEFCLFQFLV